MHTTTTIQNPSASDGAQTRRFANAGTLSVGPISLERALTQVSQTVEVSFRVQGRDDHAPLKLRWHFEDQSSDRFWMVFSKQIDESPHYQYKVRVFGLGDHAMEAVVWEDEDWRDADGSGPLIVTLPPRKAFEAARPAALPPNRMLDSNSFGLSTRRGSGSGWPLRASGIALKSDAPVPPSVAAN